MNTEQSDMLTRLRIEKSDILTRLRIEQSEITSANKRKETTSILPEIVMLIGIIVGYLMLF